MKSFLKHQRFFVISFLAILSVFLSSCVTLPDPEISQEIHSEIIGVINTSQTISQTIRLRRNGFNGINLWLGVNISGPETDAGGESILNFDLLSYSEPRTLIHHATIKLNPLSDTQPTYISFPPQLDSAGKTYIIRLSTDDGSINVYGRNEDAYSQGLVYLDSTPIETDISFSTTYDYDGSAFIDDLHIWLREINLIPSFIIILILPGYLLLRTINDQLSFDFGQRMGLSIGLSLAIIPLIVLWTSTLGIIWSRTIVLFLSGVVVYIWVFLLLKRYPIKDLYVKLRNWLKQIIKSRVKVTLNMNINGIVQKATSILLFSIFLLTLGIRLIMVRDLATPAWVDSVHHALITRLILEKGSLPDSYFPYLDLESVSYHPGFHSQLATFQLLTGLDTPTAMLIFGQVLNALMIFPVFAFTKSFTHTHESGLFAALITGLFTPMPAYYTSWGRYTQLTGLLILPSAYLLFIFSISHTSERKSKNTLLIITAIVISGLFLVHYRVTAYLILLIIAEFLISFIFLNQDQISLRRRAMILVIVALLCILFALPWLIQAVPDTFIPSFVRPVSSESKLFSDFSWRYLNAALGKQALILGGLGAIWGVIQKRRFAFLLLIWIGLLLLFANMSVLGLPGSGLINTTSIEISFFIPISIFSGYFLFELIKTWKTIIPQKKHSILNLGILLSFFFIALIGTKNLIPILNPVTFLSRNADLAGIHWIEENIQSDEIILINPFLWGYGLYAGNDGGAWITPIAGRRTIPPPVLYGLADDEERESINNISQFVIDNGENAAELHRFLLDKEIHYIFTGSRGGPLSPQALSKHPGFKSLYDNQGVHIFAVLP